MSKFSLSDFRKWIEDESAKDGSLNSEIVAGSNVEPKTSYKKLLTKIKPKDGELQELAMDFKSYGGIVLEIDKRDNLIIEVDSGTFKINKSLVKESK